MEILINNKYTNRYIKIINIDYIEIIQTGDHDQGFMDTRQQWIKYSIEKEQPLKFYQLKINPGFDEIKIIK